MGATTAIRRGDRKRLIVDKRLAPAGGFVGFQLPRDRQPGGADREREAGGREKPERQVLGRGSVFGAPHLANFFVVLSPLFVAAGERWSVYAPNITRKSVIAEHVHLAGDYERKLWFREGPDQYRTAIRHLYLCGASTYPGGGVHGACGHNAFRVIMDDLEL